MRKTLTLDAGFGVPQGSPVRMNDAAISGGMAFLVSELEKLDSMLREPLTSVSYARDIPIESGGGWVEASTVMNVDYAVSGGQSDAIGGVQNMVRTIQANVGKDVFKVFPYEIAMQVKFVDVQRGNVTGRSLEQIYDKGIRLDYDKFLDINTYQGQTAYGTYGLLNNPGVVAAAVAVAGASSPTSQSASTKWIDKTPDFILNDVNQVLTAAWAAAQYDVSAIPNHVLIDPANYAYIAGTKVSQAADKTILEFLLDNNIAKRNGVDLFIGPCRFCIGAGTGSTNRLAAYVNDKRFIGMDVPVPLGRVMTMPNVSNASYDSLYAANVGQVKIQYFDPIRYADGI